MRKEEAMLHSWTADICAPINSNSQYLSPAAFPLPLPLPPSLNKREKSRTENVMNA